MSLVTIIKKNKQLITGFLQGFLASQQSQFNSSSQRFSRNGLNKIYQFTAAGKGIRGGLYLSLYQQFGGKKMNSALAVAAGIELIQSGLLIHDDVIDNDLLRRGQPTIYAQYQQLASQRNQSELGKSLAICLGDVCYFLAFKLINQASLPPIIHRRLVELISDEIVKVGFAQMDDVFFGMSTAEPDINLIQNIYCYKTARYTFYLPVIAAVITTGAYKNQITPLTRYAQAAGMIFQITDDLINLFSSETISGKSVYSDISANKKTVIRHLMFQLADNNDRKKLQTIFGNPSLTKTDIDQFKSLYKKYRLDSALNQLLADYRHQAVNALSQSCLPPTLITQLIDLVDYLIKRKQ